MPKELNPDSVIRSLANRAAERITRRVIVHLQRMPFQMADGCILKTTWDDFCVQVQTDHSLSWDLYDDIVGAAIESHIEALPEHEMQALWLQTRAGQDWADAAPDQRERNPENREDIVNYLKQEFLYPKAADWSNPRILAEVDRCNARD